MKALVTGASGFVGQYMVRCLLAVGCDVFSLGRKPVEGCYHLLLPQADDRQAVFDAVSQAEPDYIFHLAGAVTAENLADIYAVNTLLGSHLLAALEAAGLDQHTRVLFVGSAAEYGRITDRDLPLGEGYCPRPFSAYGISKLAQTHHALAWAELGNRFLLVVRPFTILGPGMPEHLAIGSFVAQIKDILAQGGGGVLNTGNLHAYRDFLDVNDVVVLLWSLLNMQEVSPQVVNICSGVGVSMKDITDYLLKLAGGDIRLRQQDERIRSIDVKMHYGDNSRLFDLVGPYSFVPWRTTVEQMIYE